MKSRLGLERNLESENCGRVEGMVEGEGLGVWEGVLMETSR